MPPLIGAQNPTLHHCLSPGPLPFFLSFFCPWFLASLDTVKTEKEKKMISRQPPTRVLWAVGAAVSFVLLLSFFHDRAPGLNQLDGGRTGIPGRGKEGSITRSDIFNNTLGVS